MEVKKERQSGIELAKILAIFLIIIAHLAQTLLRGEYFIQLQYFDGFFLESATTDITQFGTLLLRSLGNLGNLIFIIASSYFLSNMENVKGKKIVGLAINTVIISLILLAIFLVSNVNVSTKDIIKSVFPITFQSNWFISAYLVFILVVPYLNIILKKLNQKQLLRVCCTLFIIYFCIAFIKSSYGYNNFICFFVIYFIVNYIKLYMEDFWSDKKRCLLFLAIGITALILCQLALNFMGLHFESFKWKQLRLATNNNPILLLIALSIFYLFKQIDFKSKLVNTVSSLSLYIYLLHENIIFLKNTRVEIWHAIYEKMGYSYLFIKLLCFAIALFVLSTVIGYIYKMTIEKVVSKLIEKIEEKKIISKFWGKIEEKIMKIT